jgi:hypothetical protein
VDGIEDQGIQNSGHRRRAPLAMSVVSQQFSRTSNAGGAPARENNVVSLGGAIGAHGLPPGARLETLQVVDLKRCIADRRE